MEIHNDLDRIEKVIELAAPIARVWQAVSDHQEFGKWFRVRLDNPFEVGKPTTGNITYPGHEHVEWVSLTEQLEHEQVFVFSWHPSAVDPETPFNEKAKMLVEFRLVPSETGTRLTITESGFQQFPEAKRLEILRSNYEGWTIQAKHIAAHIEE